MDGRELLDGPEVHLVRVLLPDATGQAGRVHLEIVVPDRVVEDGADLVIDRLDVGGGQAFGQKVRLPLADVRRGDLIERQVFEEGQDLRLHQVPFVLEGVRLETALHVVEVYLDHGPEGHVAAPGLRAEKFLLEGLCVLLAEEAPLLLEAAAPLPVRVVKRCVPGAPFLVFVGGQFFLHLRDMCKSCHTRPRSAQERVSGPLNIQGPLEPNAAPRGKYGPLPASALEHPSTGRPPTPGRPRSDRRHGSWPADRQHRRPPGSLSGDRPGMQPSPWHSVGTARRPGLHSSSGSRSSDRSCSQASHSLLSRARVRVVTMNIIVYIRRL